MDVKYRHYNDTNSGNIVSSVLYGRAVNLYLASESGAD